MTRKITTKRARQIRVAIHYGNFVAKHLNNTSTLTVMRWAKTTGLTRFQRKVAVDVYHRNR